MSRKRMLGAGFLSCVCASLLWGCAGPQAEQPDTLQLGVACYNQSDTFLSELLESLKEQLAGYETEQLQITMMQKDAAGSQRTQDDQVRELLDSGCNVLCVNLADRTDPSEIIDLAREREVPIIFFNREPVAEDLMQWSELYYVGADAAQSGVMQGELAAEAIRSNEQIDRNHDGRIQYVVLEGETGHQDAIIRTEKAVDTLKENGIALEKLSYAIANWSRAQAQNRMMQMVGQHRNDIEMVLANNDEMALGAVEAYEKLNYTESTIPVFFGIDGTSRGLQAIRDGRLAGTVYNDKEGQAGAIARLAVALISGEGMEEIEFENERYIYLPYAKVTADNVDEY